MNNSEIKNNAAMPSAFEIQVFKKKIFSLIELDLLNYRSTQMDRRIVALMHKNNIYNLNKYFKLLESDTKKLNEFTNMLTINVTEFFRDENKFDELENIIIPKLIETFGKNLKIWSAGCSCGAEIYSVAMILERKGILDKCSLLATDFDDNMLAKAKKAEYSGTEVKENMLEKNSEYFCINEKEKKYKVIDRIKSRVRFQKQNLLNDSFDSGFHLILCRNVVIYFKEKAKDILYKNFYNSLMPKGVLFVGTTERINNQIELGFNLPLPFFYQK